MSAMREMTERPGYRDLLKELIKSQIQHLVSQLSESTGDEAFIITASLSDSMSGSSGSVVGSQKGLAFVESQKDIRTRFIEFVLTGPSDSRDKTASVSQSDKSPPPEQSDKSAPPEQSDKSTPQEQSDESPPPEQSDKSAPPEQSDKSTPQEQSDKSPPPGESDKSPPPGQHSETSQDKDPDLERIKIEMTERNPDTQTDTVSSIVKEIEGESTKTCNTIDKVEESVIEEVESVIDIKHVIDSEEFLGNDEGVKVPVESIDDESDISTLGDADYQELDEMEIESLMTYYRVNKENNHEADIQREDVEFREHSTDVGQNGSMNEPACVVNTTPDKGACITEESGSMFQYGNSVDEHPVYVKSKDQVDTMVRKAVEIEENPANERHQSDAVLPTDKSTISPIKSSDVVDSFEKIQSEIEPGNVKNNANKKGKAKKSANKNVYTCAVCGKVWKNSGHLAEHMVVHTGLKPFKCKVCRQDFKWRSMYAKHMKLEHPDVEYKSRKRKFSDIKDKTVLKSSTNGGISDTITVKKKLSYKSKQARTEINAGLEKADNEISKNINSDNTIETDAESENSDNENNVCTGSSRQSTVSSKKQDLIKPVMDSRPERAILSPENKPVIRHTHVHSKTHNKIIATKVQKDNSIENNKPIKIDENAVRKLLRTTLTEKQKTCKWCSKVCRNLHELKEHEHCHTGFFQCFRCDIFLKDRVEARTHNRGCKVLPEFLKKMLYPCSDDGSHSKKSNEDRTNALEKEKTFVEIPKLSLFKCGRCLQSFKFRISLKKHKCKVKINHQETPRHQTEETVEKKADTEQKLPDHRERSFFKCERCLRYFQFRISLKKHTCKALLDNDVMSSKSQDEKGEHTGLNSEVPVKHLNQKNTEMKGKEKHSRKKFTNIADKTCSYCNRIFKSAHEVYRHVVVHTKEKRFKCLYCPEKFLWVERRTKHVRLHHQYGKTKTAVKERTAMKLKPSRTTENKKSVSIIKENKKNMKKGPLKLENKITKPTQNKQDTELKCAYCKKEFKEFRYLKDHIWIHTKIKRYRCTACNERFSYRRVPNHQKRCLGLAKGIQCKVVQMDKYRNMTIAQLYQHIEPNMKSKVGLGDTKHLKSNINKHGLPNTKNKLGLDKIQHWKSKQCPACEKTYPCPQKVKDHYIAIHLGLLRFPCSKCGKKFSLSSSQWSHMKICKVSPVLKRADKAENKRLAAVKNVSIRLSILANEHVEKMKLGVEADNPEKTLEKKTELLQTKKSECDIKKVQAVKCQVMVAVEKLHDNDCSVGEKRNDGDKKETGVNEVDFDDGAGNAHKGDDGEEDEISDNGDSEDFDEEEKQEKESSDEDYWTHVGHKRAGDRTEDGKHCQTNEATVSVPYTCVNCRGQFSLCDIQKHLTTCQAKQDDQ